MIRVNFKSLHCRRSSRIQTDGTYHQLHSTCDSVSN